MGCTTGNGFEHIDPSHTRRAIGVDINTGYLTFLKKRFAERLPCLELVEGDVASADFQVGPVSMVFAGLIFEYVEVMDTVNSIYRSMVPGGILLSVLQLPSPDSSPVTDTRFKSLAMLAPIMNLVSPSEFSGICNSAGLKLLNSDTIPLKKGKAFFVGIYQKPACDSQDGRQM
jgi:SAM-dependent methyltransferase